MEIAPLNSLFASLTQTAGNQADGCHAVKCDHEKPQCEADWVAPIAFGVSAH
jgi:hypothetical protein